jgi:CheY-like chemotaxis protein
MPRVLVIDDDAQFRSYVVKLLGKRGFAVTEVDSGAKAIELLKSATFDAIVTDILMPEMEGLETIRRLNSHLGNCKIIAMSGGGSGPVDYLRYAAQLGAVATLRKPFAPDEILDVLNKLLSSG